MREPPPTEQSGRLLKDADAVHLGDRRGSSAPARALGIAFGSVRRAIGRWRSVAQRAVPAHAEQVGGLHKDADAVVLREVAGRGPRWAAGHRFEEMSAGGASIGVPYSFKIFQKTVTQQACVRPEPAGHTHTQPMPMP